tara:strand:+ start:1804 stop:2076 length:273 start_codon:yes stop_codon:yes gene_type:complete
MKAKYIISCQYKEWYGNEELTEGRWKNKGGQDFIVELTDKESWDMCKLIKEFNECYDVATRHNRYEALSIDLYWSPQEAKMVDGKVTIDR